MNLWIVSTIILVSCVIVLVFVLVRLLKRLVEFDELFELFVYDISINVKFFEKLLTSPLFEMSEEIMAAQRNMKIIMDRLNEFSEKMKEIANKKKVP